MPFRATVSPSDTVWSGPASTDGGELGRPDTSMVKVRELPVPKSPVEVAVMVTVYESLVGTSFITRLERFSSK